MTPKDLLPLVKKMRQHQKDFFRTKDKKFFYASLDAEARVDKCVTAIENKTQQNLFQTNEDYKELCVKLLAALKESKEQIKTWHNMGDTRQQASELWAIYDSRSPDMKRINDIISASEKILA